MIPDGYIAPLAKWERTWRPRSIPHLHFYVLLAAAAFLSAISFFVFKEYESEIREALGLAPPPDVLSFDVGKYRVTLVRQFFNGGEAFVSGSRTHWQKDGFHFLAHEFTKGTFFPHAPPTSRVWSRDINGDGFEEFVIYDDVGGNAGVCHFWVFSAQSELKTLLDIDAPAYLTLADEDGDGDFELSTLEDGFVYWGYASHAASPMPRAIYKWKSGRYVLSTPDFYARYADSIAETFAKGKVDFDKWREDSARPVEEGASPADYPFPPVYLWTAMLDYVYFGEGMKARQLVDDVWPAGNPGKEEFLKSFDRCLRSQCRFWKETNEATLPEKRWPTSGRAPAPSFEHYSTHEE